MKSQIKNLGKFVKFYKGKGEIIFANGKRFIGKFECGQLSNGKVVGSFILQNHIMIHEVNKLMKSVNRDGHSFVGTTDTGRNIEMTFSFITSCHIADSKEYKQVLEFRGREIIVKSKKTKSKSHELHFGITNFEFTGSEVSEYPNHEFVYDKLIINVCNKKIAFKQICDYKKVIESLVSKQEIDVTSEVILKVNERDNIKTIYSLIDDLCLLLSFARGTYISWIYYDVYSIRSSKIIKTYCRNSYTKPFHGVEPIIYKLPPTDTKYFLEKSYENYKKNKDTLGLNLAIEFYVESKSLIWLEPKYLTAFLALEVLNDRNLSDKLIASKNKFRKLRKEIRNAINFFSVEEEQKEAMYRKIPEINRFPLEMCLIKMFADLSINISEYSIKRLIKLRNKIVHQGTFAEPDVDHYSDYRKLISLLDKTILSIMRYDGYYRDCLNNFKRIKLEK